MDPLPFTDVEADILRIVGIAVLVLLGISLLFGLISVAIRVSSDRELRKWERLRGKWEGTLLDILAGEEEPEAIHAFVARGERRDFLDYLVQFSRRLRGLDREIAKEIARPYLMVAVGHAIHGSEATRAAAVQVLAILGLPEYESLVVGALDDPSDLVALTAAQELAQPEHVHLGIEALRRLHRFEHWDVAFLAGLFADIGADAAQAMREILASPEASPRARAISAEALRILNDLAAADIAARIIIRESDRDLLSSSLRLLARVGRQEHATVARGALLSPDAAVRSQAARALREIGGAEDVPLLVRALEDESPWVVLYAGYALHELGSQDALEEFARSSHVNAPLVLEVASEVGSAMRPAHRR